MKVRVVTDSTSDIPPEIAQGLEIGVVPLTVHFGTRSFRDNVTITPDQFRSMLANSPESPKTSLASPGDFIEVYSRIGAGADGIVSIHNSSKISGTYDSALLGAELAAVDCPIQVIDSAQGSMGLGLVVIAAAEAARDGAGQGEVAALARDSAMRAQCFTLLESLEYLRRGGRIGGAQGLFDTLLKVRPMVILRDGEAHPLGRARTYRKALARMKAKARSYAPVESLAVMHSTAPGTARQVADDLAEMLPEGTEPYVTRFSPVLEAHTGPGAIGIALLQAAV